MLPTLVSLLVFCVIAAVLLYVARLIIGSLPLAQPFANLVYALVVLILLVLFLNEVGWMGHAHAWRTW